MAIHKKEGPVSNRFLIVPKGLGIEPLERLQEHTAPDLPVALERSNDLIEDYADVTNDADLADEPTPRCYIYCLVCVSFGSKTMTVNDIA